jgi:hypothetical protein
VRERGLGGAVGDEAAVGGAPIIELIVTTTSAAVVGLCSISGTAAGSARARWRR